MSQPAGLRIFCGLVWPQYFLWSLPESRAKGNYVADPHYSSLVFVLLLSQLDTSKLCQSFFFYDRPIFTFNHLTETVSGTNSWPMEIWREIFLLKFCENFTSLGQRHKCLFLLFLLLKTQEKNRVMTEQKLSQAQLFFVFSIIIFFANDLHSNTIYFKIVWTLIWINTIFLLALRVSFTYFFNDLFLEITTNE